MSKTQTNLKNVSGGNKIRVGMFTCAIVLSMSFLLLIPALYNGFPLVYGDSASYLLGHTPYRSVGYYIFNRIFDMKVSPWPGVVLQSLIVSWTIWQFASALFDITDFPRMFLLAVFLTVGTSLPWFVSWIMPDIFTALMIIALVLLCFAQDALSRLSKIILVMLIGMALPFHHANLPVALWIFPALGLCTLLGWRPSRPFLLGFFASGIGLTLGVVAMLTMNLASGQVGLSRSGSVFLLARMLEDGTALSYLEQTCPRQHFAVCADLNELKSYNSQHPYPQAYPQNTLFNYFFFEGPLERLGGFTGEEAEASAIVRGTLLMYAPAQFRASVDNGWRQLLLFSTGSDIFAYSDKSWVSTAILSRFGPAVYEKYRYSQQNRNSQAYPKYPYPYVDAPVKVREWIGPAFAPSLDFSLIGRLDTVVVAASSLLLIGFLIYAWAKKQPRSFYATIMTAAMVVGNAFTFGALSGPSDRYQARVIWLVPLLAGCFVLNRVIYLKHQKQSGRALEV
jgi:hypothetical protein